MFIREHEINKHFAALGAVSFHDSFYPKGYNWKTGVFDLPKGLFARHYFRKDGLEIGYVIPDFLGHGHGVHMLDQPREWGIPHDLIPIPAHQLSSS